MSTLKKFAWLSVAASVVTIVLKAGAWWLTGSVGLLSDAAESLVNLVAAIVARDFDEFLRDGALCAAMNRRDVAAVRQWIRDFMVCDGGGPDDRGMVAEIIAEATRNPRVASIFGALEDRLREHLFRALVMLVPEPEKAERRDLLGEAILIVSGGIFHRRLSCGEPVDPATIAAITGFVDRELSALMAAD